MISHRRAHAYLVVGAGMEKAAWWHGLPVMTSRWRVGMGWQVDDYRKGARADGDRYRHARAWLWAPQMTFRKLGHEDF